MVERRFGFTVQRKPTYERAAGRLRKAGMGWSVFLPHACGAWGIAGDEGSGVPVDEAVASMERFIAEAQVALAALRDDREIDHG